MKTRVSFILLLILLVGVSVEASDNFVTVYNDDLALIKQVRTIDIERQDELFRFTDVAAKLIPSSGRADYAPHSGVGASRR